MRGHAERGHGGVGTGFEGAVRPSLRGLTRLRVRYSECDPMAVVHHGAYPAWLELGRTELLRESGVSYAQLEQRGVFLVVAKIEIRYRRPVLYDDVVEVRTTVRHMGKVKIDHEYVVVVVERSGTACEEVAAAATSTIACVDREGKVRELPEFLRG